MIPDQEQNQTEEYDMSGGTVGTDTAAVLALLADTSRAGGRGGGFFGGGEGGNGGFAPWAGPGTIRADILANRDIGNTGIENLQREFASITSRDQVNAGFSRVCDKLDVNATRQSDQLFALARDVDNKVSVVTEQNHSIALGMKDQEIRNVERFCKLESGQATIVATLSSNKEIAQKDARIQALETQIQCGCHCDDGRHHGRG